MSLGELWDKAPEITMILVVVGYLVKLTIASVNSLKGPGPEARRCGAHEEMVKIVTRTHTTVDAFIERADKYFDDIFERVGATENTNTGLSGRVGAVESRAQDHTKRLRLLETRNAGGNNGRTV